MLPHHWCASSCARVREQATRRPIAENGAAVVLRHPGIHDVPFLTNTSMLALDRVPRHLVVVGGSYVGLEFAQVYRRFGAEVTVVEKSPRLVAREDEDVSQSIRQILEAEGIRIRTSAECISLAAHNGGVAVSVNCESGPPEVLGSDVLLAVGRRPNTGDLGLDRAGVAMDDRGYITVDDRLATGVPGIWALGDCNGCGAFTHTAYNDFEIVAANLLDGDDRKVSARIPGYALYIDPPLGRAGVTDAQARESGRPLLHQHAPDDARRPRGREGGDAGLHEGGRRCRNPEDPRRRDPRQRRRRGDPRHPRHHARGSVARRAAVGRADPSDRFGAHSYAAGGPEAA